MSPLPLISEGRPSAALQNGRPRVSERNLPGCSHRTDPADYVTFTQVLPLPDSFPEFFPFSGWDVAAMGGGTIPSLSSREPLDLHENTRFKFWERLDCILFTCRSYEGKTDLSDLRLLGTESSGSTL